MAKICQCISNESIISASLVQSIFFGRKLAQKEEILCREHRDDSKLLLARGISWSTWYSIYSLGIFVKEESRSLAKSHLTRVIKNA